MTADKQADVATANAEQRAEEDEAGLWRGYPAGPADIRVSVPVALGDRSYEVIVGDGVLAETEETISALAPDARAVIVTDENVARLHGEGLAASLGERCVGTVVLQPGETTKCFSQLEYVTRELLRHDVERGDLVVAFGGGVIGDLAGFAASVLRRGVRMVQIPTSLLAQVDSSVGGKTGINTPEGKNLVGAFHQPSLVLADVGILRTLHPRELRAGYAEVVKYGLLGDRSFFAWLERNGQDVLAGDTGARINAVETSVRAKAAIVAADEREAGQRALLNLGHTFGHALEAHAGYSSRLLHGEAIAIGMAQAFRYSVRLGLTSADEADRAVAHLASVGLPTTTAEVDWAEAPTVDRLMELISQDKKVQRGVPAFILVHAIGEAFVTRDVEANDLRAFLTEELARPKPTSV